jgi:hypothetical protein
MDKLQHFGKLLLGSHSIPTGSAYGYQGLAQQNKAVFACKKC